MTDDERKLLDGTISDAVANFLYYDRKEDEDLHLDRLGDLVADDDTRAWIVVRFVHHLMEGMS
jgi:hypothetical protein